MLRQTLVASFGRSYLPKIPSLLSIGVVSFFALVSLLQASAQKNPEPVIAQLQTKEQKPSRNEIVGEQSPSSQTVRDYILLGETDFRRGDLAGAMNALHEALVLDPDSEPAHYTLALCFMRVSRAHEAIEQLQKVLSLDPNHESANYNLGSLLESQGRYREALRYFKFCESRHDPAAFIHLMNVYFKLGDVPRGLQIAREATERDFGGSITAQVGLLLLKNNQYKEAAAAFEKVLPLVPTSLDLTIDLAEAYLGANKAEQAIGLLNRFQESQPSWQIDALLGQAYELAAKLQEAAYCLRKAIHTKPDEPALHYELGKILLHSAHPAIQEEGALEIQRAIDLNPQETEYYITLATWLLNQGNLKTAVDLLTGGISNTKPSDRLYLMLGLAQFWLYGSKPAVPMLQKAIQINSHSAAAYNVLGGCYFSDGDYAHALTFYQKAIQENPRNALYAYNVARTYEKLNQLVKALPFAEKSVRLHPESSSYHYLLGKLYVKLRRNIQALHELKTAVRLDPRNLPPYYLLARTYMRLNNPSEARLWNHKFSILRSEKDQLRSAKLNGAASETLRPLSSSELLKTLGDNSSDIAPGSSPLPNN